MSLFAIGDFALHSGSRSFYRIDCDALTADDWFALARMVAQEVGLFGSVEGVPRGGLKLAKELEFYKSAGPDRPLLIVDDVLTTNTSMETHRAGRAAVGCVVFARGPVNQWIRPLFRMGGRLW